MKHVSALFACAALHLAACASPTPPAEPVETAPETVRPPNVGGPCSYDVKDVEAVVVAVSEGEVELRDGDGTRFYKPASAFDPPAETGARYVVTKRFITRGTCVPYTHGEMMPLLPEQEGADASEGVD